jgi:hypothetical protein
MPNENMHLFILKEKNMPITKFKLQHAVQLAPVCPFRKQLKQHTIRPITFIDTYGRYFPPRLKQSIQKGVIEKG